MKRSIEHTRSVLLVALLWLLSPAGVAQDIHLSQFYEVPLQRNPALAGIFTGDYRLQALMRSQWNSVTNSFKTGIFSGEYKMPIGRSDDFITGGMQMFADQAGTVDLLNAQLHGTVNYHKSLSGVKPMYLSFGVTAGILRKTVNLSRVTTDNQWIGGFDGSRPIGEAALVPQFMALDAAAGVSYNANFGRKEKNMFFVGVAMHHLNKPRNSFYAVDNVPLPVKSVFSLGVRWGVDDFASFVLQADHYRQGAFEEFIGGVLYSYNLDRDPENPLYTIHMGAFIRWKDAIIPVVKLQRKQMSIGISYDVNISPLRAASRGRGGMELSISYLGFVKKMSSSQEKVLCPKF